MVTQDTYRGEKDDSETWHLYTYCANNPVKYIDPTGHWGDPIHVIATTEWAMDAGMSKSDAKKVADANKAADKINPKTNKKSFMGLASIMYRKN